MTSHTHTGRARKNMSLFVWVPPTYPAECFFFFFLCPFTLFFFFFIQPLSYFRRVDAKKKKWENCIRKGSAGWEEWRIEVNLIPTITRRDTRAEPTGCSGERYRSVFFFPRERHSQCVGTFLVLWLQCVRTQQLIHWKVSVEKNKTPRMERHETTSVIYTLLLLTWHLHATLSVPLRAF